MLSCWAGLGIYFPAQAGWQEGLQGQCGLLSADPNQAELPTEL